MALGGFTVRWEKHLVIYYYYYYGDYYCDNVLGAFGDWDFSEPPEGGRSNYKDRGTVYPASPTPILLFTLQFGGCPHSSHWEQGWECDGSRAAQAALPATCALPAK